MQGHNSIDESSRWHVKGDMLYRVEPQDCLSYPLDAALLNGYQAGAVDPIDCDIAKNTLCPQGHAMQAIGFRRTGSYRCFAVCVLCHVAVEF
jgi:hypothetical protein